MCTRAPLGQGAGNRLPSPPWRPHTGAHTLGSSSVRSSSVESSSSLSTWRVWSLRHPGLGAQGSVPLHDRARAAPPAHGRLPAHLRRAGGCRCSRRMGSSGAALCPVGATRGISVHVALLTVSGGSETSAEPDYHGGLAAMMARAHTQAAKRAADQVVSSDLDALRQGHRFIRTAEDDAEHSERARGLLWCGAQQGHARSPSSRLCARRTAALS